MTSSIAEQPESLARELQGLRKSLGWNVERLAAVAGISQRTVCKLEQGRCHPRRTTLARLAAALEAPQLIGMADRHPVHDSRVRLAERREFDRYTNPVVAEVEAESPGLFENWTGEEWEELYSLVGMGGPLRREGVEQAAARINWKRETVAQLQLVLETHLGEVAAELIATLLRMVQGRAGTPPAGFQPPDRGRPPGSGAGAGRDQRT